MAAPELVTAYASVHNAIVRDVSTRVEQAWLGLDDLSDEAAEAVVGHVVPLVGAGQSMAASVVTDYTARVVGLPLTAPTVALLVDAAAWNRSPIKQARRLVAEGASFADAVGQSAARAGQVHSGDVLRARNDAGAALGDGLEPVRPIRFAKAPNPMACDWCRLVATKLYYRADGLPVHLHDRCGLNEVTPEEAGAYTNASTVFANYRWRSRVSRQELRDLQLRIAESAAERAEAVTQDMYAMAA